MSKQKIVALEELAQRSRAWRAAGKRVVLCHGTFDLMHPGHIRYLQRAHQEGDILLVTVTGDAWSTQAGRNLYATGGGYILCYQDPEPIAGVVPTAPGSDYLRQSNTVYFGDDLGHLDPARALDRGTGPTGCVLINPSMLVNHSGMGGGRTWETVLGGAFDGAFFIYTMRVRR